MTTESRARAIEKTDLYKERPQFFRAARQPELVDLLDASFLVVDGSGSPDGTAFQDAIGALYSVAYRVKMTGKKDGRDFKVPTFEGAWWWADVQGRPLPKEEWRWHLLMMMPDFVNDLAVEAAKQRLAERNKAPKTEVRLLRIRQGLCVQMMHVGSYATETESFAKMAAFMAENGLKAKGTHHEVYLGDPRRTKPEALKTILKQPVERASSCDLRSALLTAEAFMRPN